MNFTEDELLAQIGTTGLRLVGRYCASICVSADSTLPEVGAYVLISRTCKVSRPDDFTDHAVPMYTLSGVRPESIGSRLCRNHIYVRVPRMVCVESAREDTFSMMPEGSDRLIHFLRLSAVQQRRRALQKFVSSLLYAEKIRRAQNSRGKDRNHD